MNKRIAPAAFAVVLLAASALGCGATSNRRSGALSPDPISSGEPPAAAIVRCSNDATEVATPVITRLPNGVHVEIVNLTGRAMVFNYDIDDGNGGGGEHRVRPGRTALVLPFAPRTLGVACLTPEDDAEILDFAIEFVPIAVVETRQSSLDCPSEAPLRGARAPPLQRR